MGISHPEHGLRRQLTGWLAFFAGGVVLVLRFRRGFLGFLRLQTSVHGFGLEEGDDGFLEASSRHSEHGCGARTSWSRGEDPDLGEERREVHLDHEAVPFLLRGGEGDGVKVEQRGEGGEGEDLGGVPVPSDVVQRAEHVRPEEHIAEGSFAPLQREDAAGKRHSQ